MQQREIHPTVLTIQRRLWENPNLRALVYSSDGAVPQGNRFKRERWDWSVPITSTNKGCAVFPLTFGCEQICTSTSSQWNKPLIHSPADVDRIEMPAVTSLMCGEMLELTRAFAATLPAGYFVRQTDIQSPLSVAELMWDESFYFALIETPDAVHRLLDTITTFIIRFIEAQRTIVGERFVAAGFPLVWSGPTGTMIGDDTLSLVSPEMHREFSVPYINRISKACGGIYYHTCTLHPKYFDNIHQIENILSLNWNPGNSAPAHEMIREFSGKFVIAPHIYPEIHLTKDVMGWSGLKFADEIEFMRYCIESMQDDTAMSWWIRGDFCENQSLSEQLYDLFDSYGFTPASAGII